MADDFYTYLQARVQELEMENEELKDELDVVYHVVTFMRDSNPDVPTWGISPEGKIIHLLTAE